eukprot:COSAG02_NODE_30381_length_552_cov_0.889625_1_plen_156_part_01
MLVLGADKMHYSVVEGGGVFAVFLAYFAILPVMTRSELTASWPITHVNAFDRIVNFGEHHSYHILKTRNQFLQNDQEIPSHYCIYWALPARIRTSFCAELRFIVRGFSEGNTLDDRSLTLGVPVFHHPEFSLRNSSAASSKSQPASKITQPIGKLG